MARGGLEAAIWDLEARRNGVSLAKQIGADARAEIDCGVSIGIQDSIPQLLKKIETEVSAGYQRIKMKIKPGWDIDVIREVRATFPDIRLMADANSAYTLADIDHLQKLDDFYLMMIEQPLAHDEIIDHAVLQARLKTPICLDECIRSAHHAEQAIRMKACGIINIKLGRVGGFGEAKRVHDVCEKHGIPVWCGGMLESGIGRAHNILRWRRCQILFCPVMYPPVNATGRAISFHPPLKYPAKAPSACPQEWASDMRSTMIS